MTKSSSMIRVPLFFYATVGSSALLLLLCLLSADPVSSFIGSSPSSQVRLLLHHHSRPSLLLTGVKPQQQQHIMLQPLLRTYDSSFSSSLSSSSIDDNSNDSDDIIAASTSSSSSGSLLLPFIDNYIVRKIIKISNHIPALASIGYFGLISGASMMNKNGNNMPATLVSVLTKSIGTTSNKEFSNYFSTLITPPSWVFLIWPFISVVQLVTVLYSAIRCSAVDDGSDAVAVLKQDDLTALSLSNLMASFWLYFSSKATKDYLPLGSFLVLPLVPLLSGYPLRIRRKLLQQQNKMEKQTTTATTTTKARPLFVYQVYSSFTTIAALLALTQEIQYGGRILPFIFMNRPELCAMVFLSLIGYIVSRPTSNNSSSNNNIVSKIITTSVLWGIVSKRNIDTFILLSTAATTTTSAATATATATATNLIPLLGLFGSISYFTTTILAIISTIKLFNFFSNSV